MARKDFLLRVFSLLPQKSTPITRFSFHPVRTHTPQTLEEKDSQKETPTEHSLSFEEGVQRAVEEVSSWPDWKVRSMRSIFSSQRGWKVDGKKYE